ncbi:uncharacterized protein LOC143032139 [Oratosquilla oratoria]|uniref:uncharacterized protein LOC143032139 n=1 Tax=Oratosquilla oratoria TaxID=337810 RepID=UPI003F767D7D
MQKALSLLLLLATTVVHAKPGSPRIWEDKLTQLLRKALSDFDPITIPKFDNVNIVNDHANFHVTATDILVTGASVAEVTKFNPPLPPVTNLATIDILIPRVTVTTNTYTMEGTHDGQHVEGSGEAYARIDGLTVYAHLEADSYGLVPLSMCVKPGSFYVDITVEKVEGAMEGLEDINGHLGTEIPGILEGLQDFFNSKSDDIEALVNKILCNKN